MFFSQSLHDIFHFEIRPPHINYSRTNVDTQTCHPCSSRICRFNCGLYLESHTFAVCPAMPALYTWRTCIVRVRTRVLVLVFVHAGTWQALERARKTLACHISALDASHSLESVKLAVTCTVVDFVTQNQCTMITNPGVQLMP